MQGEKTDLMAMKKGPAYAHGSREAAIGRMLDKLEAQFLADGEVKGTVADYLRLIQVMKEMGDERPREPSGTLERLNVAESG